MAVCLLPAGFWLLASGFCNAIFGNRCPQQKNSMGRNWAITIGINGYRYLQRLNYAQRDADAVRQLFLQELGFQQVYHFTDDSPAIPQDYGPDLDSHPTATTLGRFLRTRFEQPFLRDGDNLWFFFAGHGIRSDNRDYLMPIDGDLGDLARSAIPIHYISERLRRSGADNVILLIDACRSFEGKRDGFGIGTEKQQGVITLFSCSPEESSYEIEELGQGAFTYVLLESLRRQGEGNCATVERLYQQLRYYVPQITRQYKRVPQTPYGVIEPPTKNHLILLPRSATLADITTLKNDALRAEVQRDFKQAKRYWVRVLAVSPADPDAIEGIERLSRGGMSGTSPSVPPPSPPSPTQTKPRAATPVGTVTPSSPIASTPSQSSRQRSVATQSQSFAPPPTSISRRTTLKFLTWIGGTAVVMLIGRVIQQLLRVDSRFETTPEPTPTDSPKPTETDTIPGPTETPAALPLTANDFAHFEFEVVTVDETGAEVRRETKQGQVFREGIGEVEIELVAIPGGTFIMGSPADEIQRDDNEGPQREVTVPQFLIGKYPVTRAEWRLVAGLPKINRTLEFNLSGTQGDNLPVTYVT
jgi:uncharacterized caspase-like protein